MESYPNVPVDKLAQLAAKFETKANDPDIPPTAAEYLFDLGQRYRGARDQAVNERNAAAAATPYPHANVLMRAPDVTFTRVVYALGGFAIGLAGIALWLMYAPR